MIDIKVGQKVYLKRSDNELIESKIEKIGRKYFYVNNIKFRKDTLCCETNFHNIQVFLSKQEYYDKVEYNNKMRKLERFFDWTNWRRKYLNLDEIRKVFEIAQKYIE